MNNPPIKREKRALIEKEVVINGITKAEALDISTDGMYIYTKNDFIPGTIFEISFKLGIDAIKAMARVQHSQPNVGIGVQFVELSEEDSLKIKRYIEGA